MLRALVLLVAACGSGGTSRPTAPVAPALVYELQLADAVDEATRVLATNLHATLGSAGVARVRVVGDVVEVRAERPDDKAEVQALVQREVGAQTEARACDAAACFVLSGPRAAEIAKTVSEQTLAIVNKRLAKLGVTKPATLANKTLTIEVDKPELREPIRRAILSRARIDLRIVDHDAPFMLELATKATGAIAVGTDQWRTDGGVLEIDTHLTAAHRSTLEDFLAALGKRDDRFIPPADRDFGFGEAAGRWRTYYLNTTVRIGSGSIVEAALDGASITLQLDAPGARDFEQLTAENVGNRFAILIDGQVITAPIITGTLRGGRVAISLGDGATERDAASLVEMFTTGTLPVRLLLIKEIK